MAAFVTAGPKRKKKGMLFCSRDRPFHLRRLAPTEYMPTSDLLPLTPERERVRQRLLLIQKVVNSQMVFLFSSGCSCNFYRLQQMVERLGLLTENKQQCIIRVNLAIKQTCDGVSVISSLKIIFNFIPNGVLILCFWGNLKGSMWKSRIMLID